MDNLKKTRNLAGTFVDEEEAIEGVKSGAYYAAIVIPEDFSDSLLSILSGDVRKPQLDTTLMKRKMPLHRKSQIRVPRHCGSRSTILFRPWLLKQFQRWSVHLPET